MDGLRSHMMRAASYTSAADALRAQLDEGDFDIVVSDLNVRAMGGSNCASASPQMLTSVIVMTACGSLDAAVAAIRAGAYDFISKPIRSRRRHRRQTRHRHRSFNGRGEGGLRRSRRSGRATMS